MIKSSVIFLPVIFLELQLFLRGLHFAQLISQIPQDPTTVFTDIAFILIFVFAPNKHMMVGIVDQLLEYFKLD